MYSLWFLGRFIEIYYGSKNLFSIFIITALIGSIISVIITKLMMSFGVNMVDMSVGASAGLFGLIGLLLGNKLKKDPLSPELPIDINSLIIIITLNLGYGLLVTNINNVAHIGGLVAGVILGLSIRPIINTANNAQEIILQNILFTGSIVMVILSFVLHFISII